MEDDVKIKLFYGLAYFKIMLYSISLKYLFSFFI